MAVYTDRIGAELDTDIRALETENDVHGQDAEVDIEELARIRLQHSPYRAIRRVNCQFDGSILTLTGSLPTYHYKQLAQVAVAQINGVRQIVNDIKVG